MVPLSFFSFIPLSTCNAFSFSIETEDDLQVAVEFS